MSPSLTLDPSKGSLKKGQQKSNQPLLLVVIGIIGFACKYGLNVFFANQLDPHLYGDLAIALRAVNIIVVVMILGSNASANKFLPHLKSRDEYTNYIRWNYHLIKKPLFASIFVSILLLIIIACLKVFYHLKPEAIHLGFYFLAVAPFAGIFTLLIS